MKMRSGPLTMTSLIESSRIRCLIGLRNGRIVSNPFITVLVRKLSEIGFVYVVEVGLEVAKHRRHRVCAVIGHGYGLRVTQFHEGFRIEAEIVVRAVALRGGYIRLVREGLASEEADIRVVPAFREVVASL